MKRISFSLDARFIILFLLAIIAIMLAIWRPWSATGSKKTIAVTGTGTVSAVPDQFTFYPSYQKKDKDVKIATAQVSEVGNSVVEKLKELGVKEADLKTSVTSNKDYQPLVYKEPAPSPTTGTQDEYTASYFITATVYDKEKAQEIVDYLATTPVIISVTPQSSFSKDKLKELEAEARSKALQEAREKAIQTSSNLGVSLGKVVSVSEPVQGGVMPLREPAVSSQSVSSDKLPQVVPTVEIGSQEVSFSITVTYQIK